MNNMVNRKIDVRLKAIVSRAVFEFFNDPDFGLELSARTKKKLLTPSKRSKTIPLSEIKKKYY